MTVQEAIKSADYFRPNVIDDEVKASWVNEVENEIAEMMEEDIVENKFPEIQELLMKSPFDNVYSLYVMARIDFFNQDTGLYQDDLIMYESAMNSLKSFYRRHNRQKFKENWRTM